MRDERQHNAILVESLSSALRDGQQGIGTVPTLLTQLLAADVDGRPRWQHFVTQLGAEVSYGSTPAEFARFVTTPPLKGLGGTIALLERIVDGTKAKDALDATLQRPPGRPKPPGTLDNIQGLEAPSGTSKSAALRRLRKDAPELHAEVLAGKLSPHRAMVKAGFRKRTATIPVDDPEAAARTIRRQFKREALVALVAALIDGNGDR